jgi:hypothetical protein
MKAECFWRGFWLHYTNGTAHGLISNCYIIFLKFGNTTNRRKVLFYFFKWSLDLNFRIKTQTLAAFSFHSLIFTILNIFKINPNHPFYRRTAESSLGAGKFFISHINRY